jgi:hypothetical protein
MQPAKHKLNDVGAWPGAIFSYPGRARYEPKRIHARPYRSGVSFFPRNCRSYARKIRSSSVSFS